LPITPTLPKQQLPKRLNPLYKQLQNAKKNGIVALVGFGIFAVTKEGVPNFV
jgi:hypothetical protein